jgi:hypothetical protein
MLLQSAQEQALESGLGMELRWAEPAQPIFARLAAEIDCPCNKYIQIPRLPRGGRRARMSRSRRHSSLQESRAVPKTPAWAAAAVGALGYVQAKEEDSKLEVFAMGPAVGARPAPTEVLPASKMERQRAGCMPGNQLWRQRIQRRRPGFARNEDTKTSSVGFAAVMASGVPLLYYSRRAGSKIKWEFR